MKADLKHVKFHNHQKPKSQFDLLKLEDLFQRKNLDHSPQKLHLVEFYIILFISSGEGYHMIDFLDYPITKGTIITVRKDQIHKFIQSENLNGFMLLFTDEFLVSYLEKLEALKSLQLFNELLGAPKIQLSKKESDEVKQIIAHIHAEYLEVSDEYSLGIIRSQLHILITKLYRIKSQKKQLIYHKKYLPEFVQLQTLVENHVNQTIKVQDYAEMIGQSTKTLNAITKSIINKSAKEFIDEICTKQIKRLLINTKLSIKEIAYRTGFEETSNFYKYFKRHTKTTPEQFRIGLS